MPAEGAVAKLARLGDSLDVVQRAVGEHIQLRPAEARFLADGLVPIRRRADQPLFRRADAPSAFVLFDRGVVRTYGIDPKGRERNLRLLAGPNLAVALSSVIRGTLTEEHVAAVTPIEGYLGDLRRLEDHPRFAEWMRTLAEQHYLALERRVQMLQQPFAKARYEVFLRSMDEEIVRLVPDHHVASYLGVTPETLSRAKRTRRDA